MAQDITQHEFEQTLVLIKPDALKNSLTGYVLSQLSEFHTGLRFAATKIVNVSRMLAEEHYAEHRGKPFYPALLDYIMGRAHYADPEVAWKRRAIAFVFRGTDAIQVIRNISGPTDPHVAREKRPGCIRALGTVVPVKDSTGAVINRIDNLIHASANPADAEREIKLWFKPNDIPPLMRAFSAETCDDHYYYRNGKLFTQHESGSVCLVAPGDVVWTTDLDVLRCISEGKQPAPTAAATGSLASVAAKYLINHTPESP